MNCSFIIMQKSWTLNLQKMGLTSRNRSFQQTKEDSPGTKSAPKTSNTHNQSKNDLRVKEAALDQAHQNNIRARSSKKMTSLTNNNKKRGCISTDPSSQRRKEVSPRLKAVAKDGCNYNHSKNKSRLKEVSGLDQAHLQKTASNFPGPELKGIDVEDQISFIDRLSEDSDYMWLNSDSLSSSLLSSDDSQDVWDFDCMNLLLQVQFSPMSSLSGSSDVSLLDKGNGFYASDESKSSHRSETSLTLSRASSSTGKDVEELIQQGTFGNDYSVSHSERPSCYRTLFEDPSTSNSSCALPTTYVDTPSWDFNRTGIWVSSLDLDNEDSELISDRGEEFDIFGSDFPSPSFGAMRLRQIQSPSSTSLKSVGQGGKVQSLDSDSDEALYWPFDHSLYSNLDVEKFLCMSPRKGESNVGIAGFHGSKLTSFRLPESNPQATRKDAQRHGRASPSLTPKSVKLGCETDGVVGYGAQKTVLHPSRHRRSNTASSHQHLCNTSKIRGRPQIK